MKPDSKIFVTGHRGLVGSALVKELRAQGYKNICSVAHSEVDLTDPVQTRWFFSVTEPEYVFHCAARVGGIKANINQPLDFFLDNINMQQNVMKCACEYGVKKLLFLGSSCIYPRVCPQPIREEYLLTGSYTPEVEAYGLAKTCGVKLCEWYQQQRGCDFIAAMPCNIFGPGERLDEQHSHVITGLLLRMHRAMVENTPRFIVWGSGDAKREFMYSGDLARALILVMNRYNDSEHINVGSGYEVSIRALAGLISNVVGYHGAILFDETQPVGTPRKLMDNSKLAQLGWGTSTLPQCDFRAALELTYKDICDRLVV